MAWEHQGDFGFGDRRCNVWSRSEGPMAAEVRGGSMRRRFTWLPNRRLHRSRQLKADGKRLVGMRHVTWE